LAGAGGAARLVRRKGTRRVQLVRRDGRDVSTLYGRGGRGGVGCSPRQAPARLAAAGPRGRARVRCGESTAACQRRFRDVPTTGCLAQERAGRAGIDEYRSLDECKSLVSFSRRAQAARGKGTRRVQLVRRDGRGVSSQYRRGGGGGRTCWRSRRCPARSCAGSPRGASPGGPGVLM